jgi:hypothetical protein
MTTENRDVEQQLADVNRRMQLVRTALTAAGVGFGSRGLTPSETLSVLTELHNAISRLVDAIAILNGGLTHPRPF